MASDFDARLERVIQRKHAEAKARADEERAAAERAARDYQAQMQRLPAWQKLISDIEPVVADINARLAGSGLQIKPPHSIHVDSHIFRTAAYNVVTMGERSERDPYVAFALLHDGTFTVNQGTVGPPVFDRAPVEEIVGGPGRHSDERPAIQDMTQDHLKELFVSLVEKG